MVNKQLPSQCLYTDLVPPLFYAHIYYLFSRFPLLFCFITLPSLSLCSAFNGVWWEVQFLVAWAFLWFPLGSVKYRQRLISLKGSGLVGTHLCSYGPPELSQPSTAPFCTAKHDGNLCAYILVFPFILYIDLEKCLFSLFEYHLGNHEAVCIYKSHDVSNFQCFILFS